MSDDDRIVVPQEMFGPPLKDGGPKKTAYVSIGNTDNRLTQQDWHEFCAEAFETLWLWAADMHGEWYSLPNHPYQNACFCFTFFSNGEEGLRSAISVLRKKYKQDAIALTIVDEVEMVTS